MAGAADGDVEGRFNLSAWALRHRTLVLFFIIALSLAGLFAYRALGRAEDPPFTFKIMVITAAWPGSTAEEMSLQVTDKIEKKVQDVPYFDFVQSYTRPGETTIMVFLKDSTPPRQVPDSWYQVRKGIGDIRQTLPSGMFGPFFNDEFGDTFGTIYAFSGDGYSKAELKKIVEDARQRLLKVEHVGKIELLGVQDERIYIEFSHRKIAMLGLSPLQVIDVLQRQNVIASAGVAETPTTRIPVRVGGDFEAVEQIKWLPIQAGGRSFRLGDVAEVSRGYRDPPSMMMRHDGAPVIGLAVAMTKQGNNLDMGKGLDAALDRIRAELPVGVEIRRVADQPKVVERSFEEFIKALGEALAIVLAVSFITLGLRTGIVVALSVPLVLAATFCVMLAVGIPFHRISLGALIIALGLLVDDAIIAVEMMAVKLAEGMERSKAAAFAYTSTAFPMLSGTLITAAGFVPVGFANSAAGEYTNAIFWVTFIALMISWIVAVVFTPYMGYALLPNPKPGANPHGVHGGRLYRALRAVVTWCVTWRKTVVLATLLIFVASIGAFRFVPQQFFPSSSRPELLIDLRLPEGSSIRATEDAAKRMEQILAGDPNILYFTTYVGGGSPRFYLPLNAELPAANFAQIVVMTKGNEEREIVYAKAQQAFLDGFPEVRGRVNRLENGPPVGYPVQFRVIGDDPQRVREIAGQVAEKMRANPSVRDVNLQWNELTKVVKLDVDYDKARALGVDLSDLSTTLNMVLSGVPVSQFREGRETIDIVARAVPAERAGLGDLRNVNIRTSTGGTVTLDQVARLNFGLEEPILWRRNRDLMLTVRSDVAEGVQAPVVSQQLEPVIDEVRAHLPDGYRIDMGGTVEESAKGNGSIFALMPVMVLLMLTILMVQLQSFSKLALVFLTAPLGMIGVCAALLISGRPFGFVALLGTIALAGMIMRNSVILVDQIAQDIKAGHHAWDAIIDATVRRARPICLTAAAAILAMIPLSMSDFWGPMAVAIMGGLAVATLLTLLFLPALYAAWFRVNKPGAPAAAEPQGHDYLALAKAAE